MHKLLMILITVLFGAVVMAADTTDTSEAVEAALEAVEVASDAAEAASDATEAVSDAAEAASEPSDE